LGYRFSADPNFPQEKVVENSLTLPALSESSFGIGTHRTFVEWSLQLHP